MNATSLLQTPLPSAVLPRTFHFRGTLMGNARPNVHDGAVSPAFVRCTPLPETEQSYLVAPFRSFHRNAGVALTIVLLGDVGTGGEMMNFMPLLQAPVEPAVLARTLHVSQTFAGRASLTWRDVPWWPSKKRLSLVPCRIWMS